MSRIAGQLPAMRSVKASLIRRTLLRWYDRNRRDLPWRRTRDPYAIWIAEIMLQQTQIKTALPYYCRFLKAFPTLQALDGAPEEKVLALWSGLGYYRRVRDLKKAARRIAREHGGKIPADFETLLSLPGIGPYTAGALMSMAFNQPYPALDGNARRVLARLFGRERQKDLHEISLRLVSPFRPGHFNQALMEVGSRICLPGAPNCAICPLARFCAARRSGSFKTASSFSAKKKLKEIVWPLFLVRHQRRIVLRRRPRGGLLGGLWEVPGGERKKGESFEAALARHLDGLGGKIRLDCRLGEIRHSITNHKIRAPLFLCSCAGKIRVPRSNWRAISPSSIGRIPLSSLSLKALMLLP